MNNGNQWRKPSFVLMALYLLSSLTVFAQPQDVSGQFGYFR
jgi:hypothetical protein